MIAEIRKFAKSPVATALLGLLIAAFAVFGIGDIFRNQTVKDAVIQAGSRTVRTADFKQAFDNNRRRYEQQSGQTITIEQAVAAGFDKQMASGMADAQSFSEMLSRLQVRPSDKLIVNEIRKAPTFFDPVTGRFDKKAYESWLQQQGYTAERLEGEFRDDIAERHFAAGLMAGLQAPRLYGAVGATYNREGRSFSWFVLDPRAGGKPPEPTDADLTAFLKANAARFTKPETRQFSVVRFSVNDVMAGVTVSQADVQKRYDFEKDSLSTPEKRSLVQIPIKDRAKGADAAARLRKGDDPNAVAKSLGVQPVLYTDSPKSGVSDRKVADAAFALKEGETAGPIDGVLGPAVVKVTKVTPGHMVSLEEARPKIEAEVRKQGATEKTYDQVQKYQDAHAGGAGLLEVAKKLGVMVATLPPLTADGKDLNGMQGPLPPKVLMAAFALAQGAETDMEESAPGEYMAVRVDKVAPSAPVTLAEARPQILQAYMIETLMKKAQTQADALAARLRKGEAPDKVAASAGVMLQQTADMHRDGSGSKFGREFLGNLFAAKKGDVITVLDQQFGFVVAKLDNVSAGAPLEVARAVDVQRQPLTQAITRDLTSEITVFAHDLIKPKVDLKLARTAIGGEPDPAPGAAKP